LAVLGLSADVLFNPTNLPATLSIKVTPKARQERIVPDPQPDGTMRYKVYVNAPPEDGKANAAVLALLAKALGVPKSRLSVLKGETSREKVIKIDS
jgi:uncharacterized protein